MVTDHKIYTFTHKRTRKDLGLLRVQASGWTKLW